MAKPCIFCGGNADQEDFVHTKIKSWVVRPFERYPMCPACLPFNIAGNDNALVDLVCAKWNRIAQGRDDEKKAIRQARKQAKQDLQIQDKKEVQNNG